MYAVFGQKYDKKRNTSSFFYNEMRFCVKNSLIEIINVILYKLKTEYQWKYFPMKTIQHQVLIYCAVFQYYNKWSNKGE